MCTWFQTIVLQVLNVGSFGNRSFWGQSGPPCVTKRKVLLQLFPDVIWQRSISWLLWLLSSKHWHSLMLYPNQTLAFARFKGQPLSASDQLFYKLLVGMWISRDQSHVFFFNAAVSKLNVPGSNISHSVLQASCLTSSFSWQALLRMWIGRD